MERKLIFEITVDLDAVYEVQGKNSLARMIPFHGTAESEYFKGKILPGGTDTQRQYPDGTGTMSARYMLEGTDCAGKACRVFIQNEGVFGNVDEHGNMVTTPKIATDSEALKHFEDKELYGTVEGREGGVMIRIYV